MRWSGSLIDIPRFNMGFSFLLLLDKVVWSGTGSRSLISSNNDNTKPSACLRGRWKSSLKVRTVSIAKSAYEVPAKVSCKTGDRRVLLLSSLLVGLCWFPRLYCSWWQPNCQVASVSQGLFIFRPIDDSVFLLVLWISVSLVRFLHHWLHQMSISNGKNYLCTNAAGHSAENVGLYGAFES